jgi:O-antigen/teichoic acid export membrane protein
MEPTARRAMTSPERSFGANAVFSAFGWAVPAMAALVAIPITVRGLGADQYGLLALTAALTGYLGLMEMGLGSALMRYLSFYRALDQGRPMLGILLFGVRWFLAAGLIGGTFLWFAAPWLSASVLKVPPDLQATSVTVFRLTGVNFALALLVSVGTAIPQSFLRYDIASAMSGSLGTLSAVGPAIVVTLGYGLVPVVWFSVILNIAALALYAFVGYRLMRRVRLSEGPPWKEIRRRTLSFAGLTAVNQIGNTVTIQTNRLVVGIASGVAAAAYYQVPYMLASRMNDMMSNVAKVLFPTASGLLAKQDMEAVQNLYIRSSRLFFVLNFSVTMGLCILSYPLLNYWVSSAYAVEGSLALTIFSISNSLHATTMAASYINLSAARPGINVVFANVANAINLIVVYPLTVHLGINGAALAGLIAALNVPFFLHYGNRRVLHLSSWLVWRRCYQPTVLGTGLTSVAAYFLLRPLCRSLATTLVIWCTFVLAAIVVSGLFGGVSREDLGTARRLLGAPLRRVGVLRK